ncbi:MAG: hypothetical protein LBH58_06630 [Tannerellaceae bacterium]|jgi:hypothetical protein|nr:hypothetical protein [Tannerellaceae bacterium]
MKSAMNFFYHFTNGFLSVFWLSKPTVFSEKSDANDFKEIQSDWVNVGEDIRKSYEQFKKEHQ